MIKRFLRVRNVENVGFAKGAGGVREVSHQRVLLTAYDQADRSLDRHGDDVIPVYADMSIFLRNDGEVKPGTYKPGDVVVLAISKPTDASSLPPQQEDPDRWDESPATPKEPL